MALRSVLVDTLITPVLTASQDIAVTTMYLCNRSGSTVTANVYLVANGVSNYDNIIYAQLQIAGFDTYVMETERLLLGTGDSIRANVDALSANVLCATVTYTSI